MTNHIKQRRRWSLVPRVIDFEAVDIHLTIDDVMTDLDRGWGRRPASVTPVAEPVRSAA